MTVNLVDAGAATEDAKIVWSIRSAGSGTLVDAMTVSSSASAAQAIDFNQDSITFGTGTAATDITLTFDAESNNGEIKWMEDEDYFQFTDEIFMNSTEKILFGDTATFIHQSSDGVMTIDGEATIDLNASTAVLVSNDLKLDSDSAVLGLGVGNDATFTHDGTEGLTIAANPITIDSGAAINLEPASGSAILLDGTISIDGGAITGVASIFQADVKIGEDDQTKIDFETADEIHLYAANVEQVYVADNIFGPQSDSDVDLGTTGVRWKDAFVDSITVTGEVDGATLDISSTAAIDGLLTMASNINMGGAGTVYNVLEVSGNESGSARLIGNEDATATNPTLIPDRAEEATGIGGSTTYVSTIVGGVEITRATSTGLTIGAGSAADRSILFDGAAQDYHIGLDDSADDLVIGYGSTLGTTPIMHISGGTAAAPLNSGLGAVNLGQTGQLAGVETFFKIRRNTTVTPDAGDYWYDMLISPSEAIVTPGGTAMPVIATLALSEPHITASGTQPTAATTLKINNAPTEAVSGNNYALWVDAGTSRFDGQIRSTVGAGTSFAHYHTDATTHRWEFGYDSGSSASAGFALYSGSTSDYLIHESGENLLLLHEGAGHVWIGPGGAGASAFNNSKMSDKPGLTINQEAGDGDILAFKSSDFTHPFTISWGNESDTFGRISKAESDAGGVNFTGYKSSAGAAAYAMYIAGFLGEAADETDSTSAAGIIQLDARITDGSNATAVAADAANILVVSNNAVAEFIVRGNGELHSNQSATVGTFDSYDDAQLIRALDHTRQSPTMIRERWDDFIKYNEQDLIDAGILGDTVENGGMLNVTGLQRLHNGAIWQGYTRQMELQEEVAELKTRLLALEGAK